MEHHPPRGFASRRWNSRSWPTSLRKSRSLSEMSAAPPASRASLPRVAPPRRCLLLLFRIDRLVFGRITTPRPRAGSSKASRATEPSNGNRSRYSPRSALSSAGSLKLTPALIHYDAVTGARRPAARAHVEGFEVLERVSGSDTRRPSRTTLYRSTNLRCRSRLSIASSWCHAAPKAA